MNYNSKIEWTDATWNPTTGCSKISQGCKNCYAERMSSRLKCMESPRYNNGFKLTLHNKIVKDPLLWKSPKKIFVNSMSDLFHKDVPLSFIKKVFETMSKADWHIFQILTKRAARLEQCAPFLNWAPNIWMGVSVESQDYTFRVNHLKNVPAVVRFLSIEPFVGPIEKLPLNGVDWVIAGGESGPKSREMKIGWVRKIRDRCKKSHTAFFFKQWGGTNKKAAGRILDGRCWSELPKPTPRRLALYNSKTMKKVS